ncbi:hypothetical protein UVI_02062030 [Ustilaginoidea virens]|nr:hypothetical protein UVI_02062030 [Ustilaginoidea virens]
MSAGLQQPLLVGRDGFRAIRDVLSGQPKNSTEMYSSARHAPGWPPYLQPSHGMDELADPEDNWSRTVSAGMLMQEAGFAKDDFDDAVDIMQGMALDGAPTIQQRSSLPTGRNIGIWDASINATRNAQEAWERFNSPPQEGMKPGPSEYASMFRKLVLREAEPDRWLLPGDKSLNFPAQNEANLAEFERARVRPPSVSELYQRMMLDGIAPQGTCLRILVANADSMETAVQYLRDSPEGSRAVRALASDMPDSQSLSMVSLSLFAAYIQVCLRVHGPRGKNQLARAIRLAKTRLTKVHSRWVSFIWGLILKDLSQHHKALNMSLAEQLSMILRVSEIMEEDSGVQLATFTQFNKCIRKATRREVDRVFAGHAERPSQTDVGFWQALYYPCSGVKSENAAQSRHGGTVDETDVGEEGKLAARSIHLLKQAGNKMKKTFQILAEREKDVQKYLETCQVTPLERLNSRRDAIRSDDAHEYMLTLGYLGEFAEMGRLLEWLMEEWALSDVVSTLNELDEAPPYADFCETLCVFRLVAEPMLGRKTVALLTQKMADSRLGWVWPDDEAIKAYADLHGDESISMLGRLVQSAGVDAGVKQGAASQT